MGRVKVKWSLGLSCFYNGHHSTFCQTIHEVLVQLCREISRIPKLNSLGAHNGRNCEIIQVTWNGLLPWIYRDQSVWAMAVGKAQMYLKSILFRQRGWLTELWVHISKVPTHFICLWLELEVGVGYLLKLEFFPPFKVTQNRNLTQMKPLTTWIELIPNCKFPTWVQFRPSQNRVKLHTLILGMIFF